MAVTDRGIMMTDTTAATAAAATADPPAAAASRMYAAVLVYEAASSRPGQPPVFEETVTLLRAETPVQAAERAREHAESRETSYRTESGDTITWSFRHLVDVTEVDGPLGDGAEVYRRHFRDYRAYLAVEPLAS